MRITTNKRCCTASDLKRVLFMARKLSGFIAPPLGIGSVYYESLGMG
jgi:hypothetical protein